MPNERHDLLDLLDLLAGKLPAAEGGTLRRRLAEDESLRELWRRVSAVWDSTSGHEITVGGSGRSAEAIGAFLEERLNSSESASLGDACRRDPVLLEELVAAYRLRDLDPGAVPPPDQLAQRLLKLRTAQPTSAQPAAAAMAPPNSQAASCGPLHQHELRNHRPPHTVTRRTGRGASSNSSSRARRAVVAVVVAMLVLGISLLAAWRFSGTTGPASGDVLTQDPVQPQPLENRTPARDIDKEPSPLVPPGPDSDHPVVRSDAISPPMPPEPPPPPPVTVPDSGTTNPPLAVVDLNWDRIIGLIAVSGVDTDVWLGALAPRPPTPRISLVSLPESWATGRVAGTGEFVLDSDTRVTFASSARADGPPRIEVGRGRFALRGLTAGLTFVVADGSYESVVRIEEPGTIFVLDRTGNTQQAAVLAGRADLGGVVLRRRQFAAWSNGAWSGPQSVGNPPAWLSSPETASAIDLQDQQGLLASPDLLAALSALDESESPHTRQTAVGWRLSLAPQTTLLASLRSPDESTRVATVGWLMEDPQSDPSHALAWQTFVQELNDPQLVRAMRRWMLLATNGRPPTRTDYGDLLAGLDHGELGVRQIATTCLERITGRRAPAYRADGTPAERQAGIRQWRGIIVRSATGRQGANLPSPRRSRQASTRPVTGR